MDFTEGKIEYNSCQKIAQNAKVSVIIMVSFKDLFS